MDKASDLLSLINQNRITFATNSDEHLLTDIDSALQTVYKIGFGSSATLKRDPNDQRKEHGQKVVSSEKWLLPSLVVENMESEQLWQQLELWNKKAVPLTVKMSSWTLVKGLESSSDSNEEVDDGEDYDDIGSELNLLEQAEIASSSASDVDIRDEDDDSEEDDRISSEEEKNQDGEQKSEDYDGKKKDTFFDMADMEKFADEPLADNEDEMLYSDYVADMKDSSVARYSDFFDPPAKKQKHEDQHAAKDNEPPSSFELKQNIEKRTMEKIEEENLAPKPWVLSGEADARQRPQNSLLEQHLEFDHATRLAPVVTEDFSRSIEEIIKQRIIDKAWDDVERKIKPIADAAGFRRRAVLDSEKSKMSLAEVYEKDYIDKNSGHMHSTPSDMPTDQAVDAIKKEIKDLFFKLDSLSHFQFTPKPPAPELRIVKNMPSAGLEEAAPVTVSDANLLAPNEVKRPISGDLKSKEEQTETDRKRARRRAKAHMRVRQKTKMDRLVTKAAAGDTKASKLLALEKLKTGSRVKVADEALEKKLKKNGKKSNTSEPRVRGVKSSADFFARLQDEVDSQIHQRTSKNRKSRGGDAK